MKGIKGAALALVLAALAALTGCSLALPADEATGDAFVGYWVVYADNWDETAFDPGDENTQCLIIYQKQDEEGTYCATQVGGAFDDIKQVVNITDEGEEYTLSATLCLIQDGVEAEASDTEVWLEGDPVESMRTALDGDTGRDVTAYLSQEELDAHGAELMEIADESGCNLTLSTQSPHYLRFYAVRQRADGSLYAEEVSDSFGGLLDGTAISGSETQSETVNGETQSETVSVSVSVRVVPALASVRVIEMSAENEPLRAAEITKADEVYEAEADCAYAVVEETNADGGVVRALYDRSDADATHTLHYPRADGMTDTVLLTIRFQ